MGESSAVLSKKTAATSEIQRPVHPVIEIVNGTKHYGYWGNYNQVLKKLNMSVYSGQVYALLGPHGCGKSTVLNIILGVSNLNDGQVTIFGFKPGHKLSGVPGIRVGYTPQASGLYPEFTINEILRYYGALLRLNKDYVSNRIEFLSNLLALPNAAHVVSRCTESNKRQISFAVALLHEPEVLILDEPCAGINPVLKRNMWEYMKKLAEEDKAILITTQNCDEARWADRVGFMRYGNLSICGNPRELLTLYNEKHVETLYRRVYALNLGKLKTSRSLEQNPLVVLEPVSVTISEGFIYTGGEEDFGSDIMAGNIEDLRPNERRPVIKSINKFGICLHRLFVSTVRDFKRCFRSYIKLFLFIVLPSIFLTLFCLTIGTTPSLLPLGVVNYEASPADCEKSSNQFLSCQLLNIVDKHIIVQKSYRDLDDAYNAANDLQISGILIIDQYFSEYVHEALTEQILGSRDYGLSLPLILSLDYTSKIVAYTIESVIRQSLRSFVEIATRGSLVEKTKINQMIELGKPLFSTKENMDTFYMAPGIILTFVYHMAAFLASNTLVTDRVMKLTLRNYLAGVQLAEMIVSQMIVCGIITLIQAMLLLGVLFLVFDVPNKGSLVCIILIVIVQIWCGLSFGVFIAMIFKSAIGAGTCIFCFGVATLFLCGIQWPLDGLPAALNIPIKFLPQTEAVEAFRTIIHRGTSITHSRVWYSFAISCCWLLLFTISYGFKNKVI